MTDQAPNTPLTGELDLEDFTPETLGPHDEVIDGEFVIDNRGIKRLRDGRLIPGQALNPTGRPKGAGVGLRYREFKQSMVAAFHQNGGTEWLARWGRQNPSQFFRLMSRMIPHEFQGEVKHAGILQMMLPRTKLDEAPPGMEDPNPSVVMFDENDQQVYPPLPAPTTPAP